MFRPSLICFLSYLIAMKEILSKDQVKDRHHKTSLWQKKTLNDNQSDTEQARVQLNNGIVIYGRVNKTVDENKTYYSFRGIPYAKPPVGNLRFQPPVSLGGNFSEKVLYAYNDAPPCIQLEFLPTSVVGSEDCLYVNVYTPRGSLMENLNERTVLIKPPQPPGSNSTLLPVMAWIYGGGFIVGAANYKSFGPDFLLDQGDVVIVTLSYRLGVFGFLSTEDNVAPGNYGLKDQVLALRWIRDNIESFGGNPEQVTIFGESAGSASVSYLTQTPLTSGLFRGAIMESGTSLCLWALTRNPRSIAVAVARNLHIDTTSSQTLVDGLRKVDTRQLQAAQSWIYDAHLLANSPLNGLPFGPTIEPDHPQAIIRNRSYQQISEGHISRVPYIIGINSLEGVPFVQFVEYIRLYLLKYDLQPTALVPASLNVKDNVTAARINTIIKREYFGNRLVAFSQERLIKYVSDDQFVRPILEYIKLYSKIATVYFYKFSYEGYLGSGNRTTKGVGHAEELPYLFNMADDSRKPTPSDILTRRRLCKLWTNFAVTGNPTPQKDSLLESVIWPSAGIKSERITYLNIDRNLTVKENPFERAVVFWQRIFHEYGNPPYSTY